MYNRAMEFNFFLLFFILNLEFDATQIVQWAVQ